VQFAWKHPKNPGVKPARRHRLAIIDCVSSEALHAFRHRREREEQAEAEVAEGGEGDPIAE